MNLTLLIVALVCIVIGAGGGYLLFRYVLTGMLNRQLEEAEKEAQVIKEEKAARSQREVPQQESGTRKGSAAAQSAHFCSRKTNSSSARWSSISAKRT